MAARVFISYRRSDAAGDAGRLADHLQRRFGKERFFLDIDTIEPGTDFVEVLQRELKDTVAMLVVIGPRWASAMNEKGERRLEDPEDFVRRELEAALPSGIPVIPVLVQGAALPTAEELPRSLGELATRQAVTLDHAAFHADAERLCDHLAPLFPRGDWVRRAAVVTFVGATVLVGSYLLLQHYTHPPPNTAPLVPVEDPRVKQLINEASQQQRRQQFPEALVTLSRARELSPESVAVRSAQEETAMRWIREVRLEAGTSSFGEAIQPALRIVDEALASTTGTRDAERRADLLAHSGWAAFLMRRDGQGQLDPATWYREALTQDPQNPYANAMLAHWTLFKDHDAVAAATKLFETALSTGRARDAVRDLQWAAYGNSGTAAADAERLRVANAMRREGVALSEDQESALWSPYYSASRSGADDKRTALLGALPPDEHLETIQWAFRERTARSWADERSKRFWVALLSAKAGRLEEARTELERLKAELEPHPGTLRDAVHRTLASL